LIRESNRRWQIILAIKKRLSPKKQPALKRKANFHNPMKLSLQILIAFSLILLLSIIDTASNYFLSLKVKQNTEFLNKSQEIIRNSDKLHQSIIEMQSSVRGFLLTEDTAFLDGYTNGLKSIPILIVQQRKLITDRPQQLIYLDSINFLHKLWVNYATSLIDAKRSALVSNGSRDAYNLLFESKLKKQVGKNINDEVERKFADFNKIEYESRSIRSGNLISSIKKTHFISFVFFLLTIIIGITSTIYIISLISKRIKTMVRLAESISKGEFTTLNDDRKDELTGLSTSLNIMSHRLKMNIQELEKRNAELDKFAYVVSHDLKAPIRGIHNVIKWIEEDLKQELSPEMRRYLSIIPQRTKRMEDLINGLLDYARTREKTIPEKTNVTDLVKEIVETIVPRNFYVEIKALPLIVTERLKLEQVFTNLISNSVKYTQREKGSIVVSCKELKDCYEFSVKDNGIGIEPEYHERIFEIFQTLREKDEKESTGIGLSIVKKILDDQHCSIHINSTLGQGAEFVFTWPRNNID
jgi:signal transduction histidine kinase